MTMLQRCVIWWLAGTVTLMATVSTVMAYDAIINAAVLGTLDSNHASLYSAIAEAMLNEEQESTDFNSTSNSNVTDLNNLMVDNNNRLLAKPNYCKLNFEPLTFNTTNGKSVLRSLKKARRDFESLKYAVAIGPFIEVFASTDYVITQQLHVLTSSPGFNWAMMDSSKVMSILPEPSTIALIIEAVINRFKWTDVAFLAQDDFSPILDRLGESNVKVWPIRLPNSITSTADDEIRQNLLSLRESEKTKFILHSYDETIIFHVLQVARGLNLLHRSKYWFLTYPMLTAGCSDTNFDVCFDDDRNSNDFRDAMSNDGEGWPGSIFGLQLLQEDKMPRNWTNVTLPDMSRLDLAIAVDVVGLLRNTLSIEAGDCTRERVKDYFIPPEAFTWQLKNKTYPYSGALGLYVWDRNTNRRTGLSIDIMQSNGHVSKLGFIKVEKDKLNVSIPDISFAEMKKAKVFDKNDVLKVATKLVDPFVIKRGNNYIGFSVDLLEQLAMKLNFSFELFEVEDVETNAGTVNGMVFALTSGKANMAAGAMEVTAEREKVMSFSYTILSSQASILIKKAESQINSFQFLGPFSKWLWMMILVFIMVASMSLYVMSRFDPTQIGNEQRFDLKESLWYGFNIVLQGTTDYSPSTTSMRAIIAFFWFCVLIIDAAYTANLAAYLTLQQIDDRIKDVHDLAAQTSLKYGVEKNSDVMHFFQTKKEDPFEHMWAFMKLHEEDSLLTNKSDIINKVKAGDLAFISDEVTNNYYANQHCGIESIEQSFGNKDFSLGFPRGTPHLDDINQALLELKEEGVFDQLTATWLSMGTNCTDDDDTRSISQKSTAELELTNMIGVFIVLGFFIAFAVFVDIACRIYVRNKSKKEQEKEAVEMDISEGVNGVENSYNQG